MFHRNSLAKLRRILALLALLVAVGCKTSAPSDQRRSVAATAGGETLLGEAAGRPARLSLPMDLARGGRRPLLIALHGYGDRGERFLAYLGYEQLARRKGFFLSAPDGTPDPGGLRFWNAGDACCNFHGSRVDDVAYLSGLIREAAARYPAQLDPSRVYLIGLSNGGFMAYRLACEGAPVAALVSIAGALRREDQHCAPAGKVSVLHVHPSSDQTVHYQGGTNLLGLGGNPYPGARASLLRWARLSGCSPRLADLGTLDLSATLPGAETSVERADCPKGALDLRLWTIRGAPHVPDFSSAFAHESWAWLAARRR